jgi:hypothetical protein
MEQTAYLSFTFCNWFVISAAMSRAVRFLSGIEPFGVPWERRVELCGSEMADSLTA